uniref:Uncharacterized protein n=1 Tax=Fagus sylvatica TaxID=28930 RepID=A0A2N9ISS5_FAGSY
MIKFFAPNVFAEFNLAKTASYSASLFDALKLSRIDCSITVSSDVIMTTPVFDPLALEAPSMYIFHHPKLLSESCWEAVALDSLCPEAGVNSATKSAISNKSQWMIKFFAPNVFAEFNPAKTASYSASLFDALKLSRIDCSITVSSDVIMTTPVPDPLALEAPSTYIFHHPELLSESCWEAVALDSLCPEAGVNSATKSARIHPFMAVLGRNFTSKAPIFAPHFEIRLVKSDF